ncbi:aminotransferase class I/II-fold pyridoxal phosphate-dependent enzyme [Biostraticola tofi]|uniref:7-keto-8-aminopelargonate synthetase-like enzyme n=1 Tax=Biostraticola tofi TaxID=466109 RepID=A0A4R3YRZ7_9GAMM|nr:aminotransferase class I/II-fold pyridoxal phosphate-dependent enzyme [Biostraticola tofi]TCV94458.1 7-keto-8-aminopelargonate synthetase-like enzyme [Biostraticola tofi]
MGAFANVQKMVTSSLGNWRAAARQGLVNLRTVPGADHVLVTKDNHRFINMCSCSYLGLNRHPSILAGAMQALEREGTMSTSVSRARIAPQLLDETEELMGRVFNCEVMLTPSCYIASAAVLPLLASGHFTEGHKPLMVFDAQCHFSMSALKAQCSDETDVCTCPHNDMEYILNLCRSHDYVVYICDGAYSMGGNAPIQALIELQREHNLFLYIDDSHSISVQGIHGSGLARSHYDDLSERTIIVASLAKAFGATGGAILLGDRHIKEMLTYCGGPLGWSQMINAPGLGAIKAAAELHLTGELEKLQQSLKHVMNHLDKHAPTVNAGNGLPIRVINMGSADKAIKASVALYQRGFYCSTVFFPIVAQNNPGIRLMGRANLTDQQLGSFCQALSEVLPE